MIVDLTKPELEAVLIHLLEQRWVLKANNMMDPDLNTRISQIKRFVNHAAPESVYQTHQWDGTLI